MKRNFELRLSKTREYGIWNNIIQRCENPKNPDYHHYGGRGITICDRWRSDFMNFYNDMGLKPKGKSIDRINNDMGYSPENCRWATRQEQVTNQRSNRRYTLNGETLCLSDWSRKVGITLGSMIERIDRGWPIEKALTKPSRYASNSDGNIDVPDELMPLFNRFGTQIRVHTISGKEEVLTVAHMVQIAQRFFNQCRCLDPQKHGETSIMCCNRCGLPTEEFWTKKIEL